MAGRPLLSSTDLLRDSRPLIRQACNTALFSSAGRNRRLTLNCALPASQVVCCPAAILSLQVWHSKRDEARVSCMAPARWYAWMQEAC